MSTEDSLQRLQEVAAKLHTISRENTYDPYVLFEWPDSLPADDYWMAPELMTCYGTMIWDELTDQQKVTLSHWESVNFFSLNVHLIRELIGDVADRIYQTRFPGLSEFFHDFLGEENKHMWFFATFCLRYGGKVYPGNKAFSPASAPQDVLRDLMVFGRILIAEELCDTFNVRMSDDARLPEVVQQINRVHHRDEARHIAFGRQMMRTLCDRAQSITGEAGLQSAGDYLSRYVSVCLRSFYNPVMYEDAGLEGGRRIRARLLDDPARERRHRELMSRTTVFLERIGLAATPAEG